MAQKTYINGVFLNEIEFKDGGSLLKMSIPSDKIESVCDQLRAATKDGWCSLVISRMREPMVSVKTGRRVATHSLAVDSWQPKQGDQKPAQSSPRKYDSPIDDADVPKNTKGPEDDDDVPF
jgi:hypothetical protein